MAELSWNVDDEKSPILSGHSITIRVDAVRTRHAAKRFGKC